jgi:hypothetical protein
MKRRFIGVGILLWGTGAAFAHHYPRIANPSYDLVTIRPANFQPAVAGMDFLPNGDLILITWRGTTRSTFPPTPRGNPETLNGIPYVPNYVGHKRKVFRLSGVRGRERNDVRVTEVAPALDFRDPMGLIVVDGEVYVGDIHEIVKLVDSDNDGLFDRKQLIGALPSYQGWFEYSAGPVYKDGYFYMAMACGVKNNGTPEKQLGADNGTVVRVPIGGGRYEVIADGLRAPDGIGLGIDDEIFVNDNQGGYRPASPFFHVQRDKWYGYVVDPAGPIQKAANGTMTAPAIWAPQNEANDSPTEPCWMKTGRFKGQFLYGDISKGGIYRAYLEKVNGQYQGGVVTLGGGLEVGIHRCRVDDQGHIYLGGLGHTDPTMEHNQGWNHTTYGLQKLIPNNYASFEIVRAYSRQGGMEVEFTQPLAADAVQTGKYSVSHWHYEPTQMSNTQYGGPKVAQATLTVASVQLSPDGKSAFLRINGLNTGTVVNGFKTGKVVHIRMNSLQSSTGQNLLYNETWYTLNNISSSAPFTPVAVRGGWAASGIRLQWAPQGLRLDLPDGSYRVELLSLDGRLRAVRENAVATALIRKSEAGKGLHFLRLQTGGRVLVKPVMF